MAAARRTAIGRGWASALACALVVGALVVPSAASATRATHRHAVRIGPRVERALHDLRPGRKLGVIVHLAPRADLSVTGARTRSIGLRTTIHRLQASARAAQGPLLASLSALRGRGAVARVRPLWVIDAVAVHATEGAIARIAARADVRSITLDARSYVSAGAPASTPEPNIALLGAPTLWTQGFTGSGVVVANMDTGVDATHPDLAGSYRGGTNSWFDASGQHPSAPVDLAGHGTSTMGLIVGRDAGGTAIGVAPDATWIATRIFNDQGVASTSGIHAAFQWLLDPDGNTLTNDAPDVVEGSWTMTNPGCDLTFEPDLEALRSAGILPIFAAGNGGPSSSSSFSPGNNPAAFSIGATDNADVVASFSSRGPSTCGGRTGVFPDLMAPGVNVRSDDLYGSYAQLSGTSLAAPQVAGAAALLLQAHPGTTPSDLATTMTSTAVDLGASGPDDTYGNGRLDIPAALAALGSSGGPSTALLSIHAGGGHTLGSVTGVQKKDVVSWDGTSYAMVFDGSDVGLGSVNVDAVARLDASTLLLSFDKAVTLAGAGAVDDSDVVRFDATSLGTTTAGTFSMWFDGSDVGLTTDAEDVDALALLPDGRVVLSTTGANQVAGIAAGADEDLLAFTPTTLGTSTSGSFAIYLDGSDVGLTASTEDVDAVDVATSGAIDLSTTGAFDVTGVAGDGDDVFTCAPTSLGANSACSYSATLPLDGSAIGLASLGVDGFDR